ncbi:hypothetical protein IAG25_39870 [Caballeronia sp. EK]|uniref:hypothetical protein n=1 Tax=Caballeronia sp. EK TaxID=2767469 RepID=UPI001655CE6F|nr:hypothetical protein [Caballeronia sp. EK]MBC8642933.1 hypothetical protein [Caballeronia sp. EK]
MSLAKLGFKYLCHLRSRSGRHRKGRVAALVAARWTHRTDACDKKFDISMEVAEANRIVDDNALLLAAKRLEDVRTLYKTIGAVVITGISIGVGWFLSAAASAKALWH